MRRRILPLSLAVMSVVCSPACGVVIGSDGSAEVAEANLRAGVEAPAPVGPLNTGGAPGAADPELPAVDPSVPAGAPTTTINEPLPEMSPEEQLYTLQALAASLSKVPGPVSGEGRCAAIATVTNVVLDILRIAPEDVSIVTALLRRFRAGLDDVRLQSAGDDAVLLGTVIADTDRVIAELTPTSGFRTMAERMIVYLNTTGRVLDQVLHRQIAGCDGVDALYSSEWIDLLIGAIGEKIA